MGRGVIEGFGLELGQVVNVSFVPVAVLYVFYVLIVYIGFLFILSLLVHELSGLAVLYSVGTWILDHCLPATLLLPLTVFPHWAQDPGIVLIFDRTFMNCALRRQFG